MNIFVCIKQVPDTTEVRLDKNTNTLIREGVPSIINPFDMYAIEEALRIKEKLGGTVNVISMGPPQVADALREAVSLGADEAYLVSDRKFAGADTWATSLTLAAAIKHIGKYDLIICGKQAIDGDTAQVGPGIAENLSLPQATFARKIREINEKEIICERMTDEGNVALKLPLPALITVVKEINTPRLPSLKGKMRSRKYEPKIITNAELNLPDSDIGLDGSPTQVVKVFTPPGRTAGIIFEGEAEKIVEDLVDEMKKLEIVN